MYKIIVILCLSMLNISKSFADSRYINTANLKAMIADEWKQLDSGASPVDSNGRLVGPLWSRAVTIPFPAVWPPENKPQSVYYGYARGFNPRVTHSENIAEPWVKITIQKDGRRKIETLRKKIVEMESEGMWYPYLRKGVRDIYIRNANAPDLVANLTRSSASHPEVRKRIRAYYCQWSRNKIVATRMAQWHPKFYAWLDCR